MASEKVLNLTDDSFKGVISESDTPVLVDFWAEWCGPCKRIGPIIEELAEELGDKAKICKVNVDENQSIAEEFGIMSIPALLLFNNGELVDQMVGYQDKDVLSEAIERVAT